MALGNFKTSELNDTKSQNRSQTQKHRPQPSPKIQFDDSYKIFLMKY